jgi:nucleoside recognition membrane protein YjiH
MSEVGILILRSPIPLGFMDMVLVFLLRTAIALPCLIIAGRLLGFE